MIEAGLKLHFAELIWAKEFIFGCSNYSRGTDHLSETRGLGIMRRKKSMQDNEDRHR